MNVVEYRTFALDKIHSIRLDNNDDSFISHLVASMESKKKKIFISNDFDMVESDSNCEEKKI